MKTELVEKTFYNVANCDEIKLQYCKELVDVYCIIISNDGYKYMFPVRYDFNYSEDIVIIKTYNNNNSFKEIVITYVVDIKKMRQDRIKKLLNNL